MKKLLCLLLLFAVISIYGQKPDLSRIDIMLVKGEYQRVIDTCSTILSADSMNAEIWYKMGLAYQNTMPDENSFDCFRKASGIEPGNSQFKFMVAKGYLNKNKNNRAKPLLLELTAADSLNWQYAYYLTGIYMQEGKLDDCINIYNNFYSRDTTNYIFLDKLGYAFLRKGKIEPAISYFNKSLALNEKNINAIKNLAYLYPFVKRTDTALVLLDRAIQMDPEDMDLLARRATIYFNINYNKKALNDYLKILASGDSSFLYLKRAGIGYTNNLQPKLAIPLLVKASRRDTTDYETLDYLARCYHRLNDLKKSEYYYLKITSVLGPLSFQLGITHMMLAEEYKADSLFSKAADNYVLALELTHNPAVNIMLANLYDKSIVNSSKAIYYYRQFINGINYTRMTYNKEYVTSIKKRIAYLEEQQQAVKTK